MPASFKGDVKRKEFYSCFPEEIQVRADLNGRHEKPDVEWLIADILKHGQLEPVLVWSDAGVPVLSAGFSRWRSISEINKRKLTPKKMEIYFTYIKCNEQGGFIRNISENRMRNPTSPIDDAHNIQRLFEWTMGEEEVAKIYFPVAATEQELKDSIKWIRERVNLIKLTPEAERAMKDGRLSETAAQAIAKLSSSQQKEALKKQGNLTAKDIKANAPKSNRGRKPNLAKMLMAPIIDAELRRRITAVVESADWEDYDESVSTFIEVDADLLAKLKNYVQEQA